MAQPKSQGAIGSLLHLTELTAQRSLYASIHQQNKHIHTEHARTTPQPVPPLGLSGGYKWALEDHDSR